MTRTLAITSGKGGVGKTNISLNLALQLAALGKRTCLFDADFGTANVNILLGISPRYDIKDVIVQGKTLADIIIGENKNLDILPGSSGVEEMANLSPGRLKKLLGSLAALPDYDFLVVDTAAGISKNVVSFCLAAGEVVLVITHEPTSLTDAFALLKVLAANGYQGTTKVVVNRCHDSSHARITFATFKNAVSRHLQLKVAALGLVLEDSKMVEAIRLQQPFLHKFPQSQTAKCFHMLASRLIENKDEIKGNGLDSFWRTTMETMTGPLTIPSAPHKEVKETESMALTGNNAWPATEIVQELKGIRQALDNLADKGLPQRQTGAGPTNRNQAAEPVVKLDLSPLLATSQAPAHGSPDQQDKRHGKTKY
ncbi:MAG: hypothetical protein C0613_15565 [Desulfobulbaceae bacterium]|nr:MAG: hypothetical protein C0613_15565 [Desulfobulbaceae bacterium]